MRSSPPTPAPSPPAGRLRLTDDGVAWLAGAAVLGGLGWLKGMNLVLVLAYGMAALVGLNAVLARRHGRRLAAVADPAGPILPGEEVRLTVRVRNADDRPADGVTAEVGPPAPGRWAFARLLPGGEAMCVRHAAFPRRGRQPLAGPTVGSGFPFGFVRYTRAAVGGEVVVLPAVGQIDPAGLRRWLLAQAAGADGGRSPVRRGTADTADVRGVRPYRSGDGLRLVHWRSSARHRKLMVREYDAAVAPGLVLAVEPWLPARPTPADRERLEAALSLAATVARAWAGPVGAAVTLWVAGSDEVRELRPDRPADRLPLAALGETAGGEVADAPPLHLGGRGRAVRLVVSSRPGSPLAAALGGRPAAALDPTALPPWYQPPAGSGR